MYCIWDYLKALQIEFLDQNLSLKDVISISLKQEKWFLIDNNNEKSKLAQIPNIACYIFYQTRSNNDFWRQKILWGLEIFLIVENGHSVHFIISCRDEAWFHPDHPWPLLPLSASMPPLHGFLIRWRQRHVRGIAKLHDGSRNRPDGIMDKLLLPS